MELGVGVLDLDHKQLATLFKLLDDALELMPSHVVDMLIDRLIRETREHFRREEEFFAKHSVPDTAEHLSGHAEFLRHLGTLAQSIAAADKASAEVHIQVCRKLFVEQLLPSDKALMERVSAAARP
jgi:hemerythrin-like metal-binding protein